LRLADQVVHAAELGLGLDAGLAKTQIVRVVSLA